MIYDMIAYYKPSETSHLNIGNIIKRIRVLSEDNEELDLVGILNNFFSDVNPSTLSLSQPATTLLFGLSKVQTDKEVNDILGALRYYGVYFSIVELPNLVAEPTEQENMEEYSSMASGYLTLRKSYKSETYSVPVLYSGTMVNFKEIPSVGVLMIELLKLLPLPENFQSFTNVRELLNYYGTTDLETAGYVDVDDIIVAINSLGYEYIGLI